MMLAGLMSRWITPRVWAYSMALQTSDEPAQELAQGERAAARVVLHHGIGVEGGDGVLEAIATDEPHGVIGTAAAIAAEAVDRHDSRMLEPAGDLGFENEPGAAGGIVGVMVEDLLEGDLTVELGVECDEDRSQPSASVGPQHAKPLAVAGGSAHRGRGIGVDGIVRRGRMRARADVADGGVDVGIAHRDEAGHHRPWSRDGGEALFDVIAMPFQVLGDETFQDRPIVGVDGSLVEEDLGDRSILVAGPGVERGDERGLVDHAVLQREQAEEEVAVSGNGHGVVTDFPGVEFGGAWR